MGFGVSSLLMMFLPGFACKLIWLSALMFLAKANLNDKSVGSSREYVELEYDTVKKKMFKRDKDALIVFYADRCTHCQDLHPYQEKAAKVVKKKTDKILFGRIDVHREQMSRILKRIPIKEDDHIPMAYFVKAGHKDMVPVDYVALGWGNRGGHRTLVEWIEKHTSFKEEFSSNKKKTQKEPSEQQDAKVSCGGHSASSCAMCGQEPSFCNGDCIWSRDMCINKARRVSCGGHSAATCATCGDDPSWCNGDCEWFGDVCMAKVPEGQRPEL